MVRVGELAVLILSPILCGFEKLFPFFQPALLLLCSFKNKVSGIWGKVGRNRFATLILIQIAHL